MDLGWQRSTKKEIFSSFLKRSIFSGWLRKSCCARRSGTSLTTARWTSGLWASLSSSLHRFEPGPNHKTFYDRNLSMFEVSQSVCPLQAFPAQSYVCGKGQEPILQWGTLKVLCTGWFFCPPKMPFLFAPLFQTLYSTFCCVFCFSPLFP